MFFLLCLTSNILTNEVSSFTVFNNVTIKNNDILKELLFRQMQNYKNDDFIAEQESVGKYDSKKCVLSLREITDHFPDEKVFQFFDAWGHLPSGLASGNYYDVGEFDQCLRTSVSLNKIASGGIVVNGQYCFVSMDLPKSVQTGICIPDTCSPEFLTNIFKNASDKHVNGALSEKLSVEYCTDGKIPPMTTIQISALSIFSVVTVLMILSSLYDFLVQYYKKKPLPVLLAFSILSNGSKLFATNTKRSRNSIGCFNGIRVLSTLWIMIHHTSSLMRIMRNIPMIEFLQLKHTLFFMPFAMSTISLDSFFFIGGLLVAFNGFKDLDETKGKINITRNIIHRYIRLTPIVAAGLLLYYGIHEQLFSSGPFKDIVMETNNCDENNWWPNLLFIQNYYFLDKICYVEAWYLAVDFQLYIFSPLLLISMWKWGTKIIYLIAILIVTSISYVIAVYFMEEYTAFTPGINIGEWEKVYVPTHARCNSWLIGFVFGYFMHYHRQADFNMSRFLQLIGWIGSLVIMIAVVYGPFPTIHAYGKGSVFEAAMYEGFKHIFWSAVLVWITFACHYGFGGVVDAFLSHPIWQPLSRLTYALCMMHMAVLKIHFAITRHSPVHFSTYNCLMFFWVIFGETLLISIFMTLGFELPVSVVEKFLFGKVKKSTKLNTVEEKEQTTPLIVSVNTQWRRKLLYLKYLNISILFYHSGRTMQFHCSLFLIIIFAVINRNDTLSIVNNVSVSSDVLSKIFFEEIKNNPNKVYTSGRDFDQYNTEKCIVSLREIIQRYPSLEVARVFDAWGNLPAGISTGNQYDLGNYDECVKFDLKFYDSTNVIRQQYCFATLLLKQDTSPASPFDFFSENKQINVGICIPESCSPDLLTSIFRESSKNIYAGALSEITVRECSDGRVPRLTASIIACISVLGILTILMILSSVYDIYVSHCQKNPNPVLIAFSILTNGKRLFAINTKRSRSSIDCLTGIRAISTLWIINHHVYTNVLQTPAINFPDISAWFFSWEFMPIYNASISVDTFFFMGGLLVAWIGFKELDKTNGKINFFMNIIHRYIRLTPVLAAGLVLAYSINKIIYTGPFRDVYLANNNCNSYNWWPILLYIQNYYTPDNNLSYATCYAEAWYLAIDFQLYALSPMILVPMWKWGRKFASVLLGLGLISIGWVMGIYFYNNFNALILGVNPHEWEIVYTVTHTRFAPWLIGFGFGYFMHKNRESQFKISKIVQIIGWILSFFTMTAIVFGTYFSLNANYGKGTVFEAAMYESLKRVSWALAQVWITFACHYGYGGIVDAFLSHPFWQPFGRLSYAMYMMHMAIIRMHFGMTRTEIYFSVYNQFLNFWSAFGTTLLVSIYVTLAFESPVLVLERIIFNRKKSPMKKEDPVVQVVPANVLPSHQHQERIPE
ncbi:uncharacterized protein LOC129948476 [Eupeodes corollae]|uniref:uncharacterized protein LOC129948476 n=1 Tax=Eupeodes corollae TaxID=290404 RepID=UPI00248F5E0A|nr:uncharacterized protein LOC129948476 [Eupeodes corollae]